MTYCDTLTNPLVKKIEAGEDLDQIGQSLCGNTVKNPRSKAIRIIKALLGESYLKRHAETLKYHANKAVREKSSTEEAVNEKIVSKDTKDAINYDDEWIETGLIRLINKTSYDRVMAVLEEFQS